MIGLQPKRCVFLGYSVGYAGFSRLRNIDPQRLGFGKECCTKRYVSGFAKDAWR